LWQKVARCPDRLRRLGISRPRTEKRLVADFPGIAVVGRRPARAPGGRFVMSTLRAGSRYAVRRPTRAAGGSGNRHGLPLADVPGCLQALHTSAACLDVSATSRASRPVAGELRRRPPPLWTQGPGWHLNRSSIIDRPTQLRVLTRHGCGWEFRAGEVAPSSAGRAPYALGRGDTTI